MAKISMRQMLEAGVHFGHKSRFWHPKMAPYIFGVRNKIHIINLEHTLPMFVDALNFAGNVAARGEEVLFVGTKRNAGAIIKEQAERCAMPYVHHRWLGGMLTNYQTIAASIKRLQDLEFLSDDNFSQFSKKEALMMMREKENLDKNLGGIKNMNGIPSAIFVVDIGYEKNAVNEAKKLDVPIIGVVDTNHNPQRIDYVIPGNDDAIRSIEFYVTQMATAILEAKELVGVTKPPETEIRIKDKTFSTEPANKTQFVKEPADTVDAQIQAEKQTEPTQTEKTAESNNDTLKPEFSASEQAAEVAADTDKTATSDAEAEQSAASLTNQNKQDEKNKANKADAAASTESQEEK